MGQFSHDWIGKILLGGRAQYLPKFFFFFFEIPMGGEFVREYVNF